MNPQGAIQSFGGTAKPNTMKDKNGKDTYNYGGLTYNTENGSFTCNGIERYGIAIGPVLQNPNFDVNAGKNPDASDMIYGTFVDVVVKLEGNTYYIPAIIVDTKAHSAPYGTFQTGVTFTGENAGGQVGPIVEWYVSQSRNTPENKSMGLNDFNDGSIIIYRDQRLEHVEDTND